MNDPAGEIRCVLDVLIEPGSVVELRVPQTRRGTMSGYYTDLDRLAADAAGVDGEAPGVYVTLNPVERALLARADNRLKPFAKTTTGDQDIIRRRWLLVNFDPERPAAISSTEGEHDAALARMEACRTWLLGLGASPASLITADS